MIGRTINYNETIRQIKKSIKEINTMFVGVIVDADYKRNRYGVQPVLMTDNGIPKGTIASCPMSFTKTGTFYIRAPYEVGDMVYVGCSKESIDESIINGSVRENRIDCPSNFRIVDGVVLGGIVSDSEEELDSNYSSDFIIQNRKNKDTIVLKASGGIKMVTGTKVEIESPLVAIESPETTISGTLTVQGTITGNSTAKIVGALNAQTVTDDGGVSLGTHTHMYNPGDNPPTSTGQGEG